MKFLFVMLSLFVFSTSNASPQNEENIDLNAMKIKFSWQTQNVSLGEPSGGPLHAIAFMAKPLLIDVWTESSQDSDPVQVVVNNYCDSSIQGSSRFETLNIDLKNIEPNHFQVRFEEGITISLNTYYESFKCHQDLAVVKAGQWFKDPKTNNNYKFILK